MNFTAKLRKIAENNNSIVCLGMDPVIEKIPLKEQSPNKKIEKFYTEILEVTAEHIGAVKPNYAFFAQYGFPGLRALKKIIVASKRKNLPVILDVKRGDVGKSSEAYASEIFKFWKADAVTVSPYMGSDSVQPFINYCEKGKGVYILTRTSNPGAKDIQEVEVADGNKVYMVVAKKILQWKQDGRGAVVGATSLAELSEINRFFQGKIPLLIPGVGAQGGNAGEVVNVLKNIGDLRIHRINSSSRINYAYEKTGTDDYAGAAVKEVEKLNREIRLR